MSKYVVKKNGVVYEGGTLQTTNNFVSVQADGVKTYGQLLKELGLLIDSSRVTRDAVLVQKFTYTETFEARALFVSGFNDSGVTLCRTHYDMLRAVIHYDGSSSTFDSTNLVTDTGTDFTNTVAANTVSFFFYYSSALALDKAQGSGGGHTIQNSSGVDLDQEDVLQFVDASVTDDSTNGKTKVENTKVITSSELENAPDGTYIVSDRDMVATNFFKALYPVGSIYFNTNNVNPSTFLGFGTWTLMSDGYLRNNASAASGGSLTSGSTTLTVAQIPAHTHTATTQNTGAHTHTATTQNTGAHTHTATTGSYGNHTHTATTQSNGSHQHNIPKQVNNTSDGGKFYAGTATDYISYFTNDAALTGWAGTHSHTLTTQNTGAHTHTLTTGSYGNHTHTLTTESKGNHTHTLTTQSIGGGEGHTHTVEPPYIRVYAFERTA